MVWAGDGGGVVLRKLFELAAAIKAQIVRLAPHTNHKHHQGSRPKMAWSGREFWAQLCRRSSSTRIRRSDWRGRGLNKQLQLPGAWSVELACYRRYQRMR